MLLTSAERAGLQFQPVERPKRARKQYFELIGPSGPPLVAAAGLPLGGWRCPDCGYQTFSVNYSPELTFRDFIARSDLPQPLPSVFTVGVQPNVQLCVTEERWAELRGRRGTRRFVSSPLGVVSDDELVRSPELVIRTELSY